MDITFRCFGLDFEAEVDFTPGIPGRFSGPPEKCYPDEGAEIEFKTLTCEGNDALFLLESGSLCAEIEEAAIEAAEEKYEPDADDYYDDRDDAYYDQIDAQRSRA